MRRKIKAKAMRFTFRAFLVVVFACGGLASCTYYTNEYNPAVAPDDLSFSEDIIPIFDASCSLGGCHNGTIPPDLRADNAYANLVGLGYVVPGTPAEDNILYQVIDGGVMDAYATDKDRAYIKKWIDEGALDN